MELTEHTAGNHYLIGRIEDRGICIGDRWYRRSLVVGARYLDPEWPVSALEQLDENAAEPLIALQPELVIIGIGQRQQILPHALQLQFIRHGIGIECMTLHAASRTFNVLMSENRRALAALIFSAGNQAD
ncbi:MAG: hypothetical protein HND55_06450 [Pseudomonadota bacterium]|nr:MAG: hypothetical protein HND55_06450 [Pseudomonadota bacterium]